LRESSINFYGNHLARTVGQQPGHGAPPRADFNHHIVGSEIQLLQNFVPIALVMKKCWPSLGRWREILDFRFWILDSPNLFDVASYHGPSVAAYW